MAVIANRKVRVVNKGWEAINFTTLEKAMLKLTGHAEGEEPKAEIIDCTDGMFQAMTWDDWSKIKPTEGQDAFRSASDVYRIPTVIRVLRYSKQRREPVKYNRRTVYRRDNFTCQYCGDRPGTKELSMDHVIPRCQGGKTEWENIVVACTDCNSRKAGRTPEQAGMKLIRKPHKPQFNLYPADGFHKDWSHWFSDAYWNVTLENDMEVKAKEKAKDESKKGHGKKKRKK